jgi:hypothetical protein
VCVPKAIVGGWIYKLGNVHISLQYLFKPVGVSSVDDFSTQDTYLEQILLLLHIIESRL